jgi:transcriptional regulator with XRE-family HTH domain
VVLFARLGRALRLLRETLGKSQKQVAAAAGITSPMLSAYERERTKPEMETLDKVLSLGLGASLADLAWALDVVNERLAPARRAPAVHEARPTAARDPLADPALAALLGRGGEGLPPALEEGYSQIVRGLLQVSRFVFERVARVPQADPAGPHGASPPTSGSRR